MISLIFFTSTGLIVCLAAAYSLLSKKGTATIESNMKNGKICIRLPVFYLLMGIVGVHFIFTYVNLQFNNHEILKYPMIHVSFLAGIICVFLFLIPWMRHKIIFDENFLTCFFVYKKSIQVPWDKITHISKDNRSKRILIKTKEQSLTLDGLLWKSKNLSKVAEKKLFHLPTWSIFQSKAANHPKSK